jgi:trehalose 6-phosphate phosphatase
MTSTPASSMALPLFDHLSEIASMVRIANRVFLFLDFDGTLAPVVEDPGGAAMSPRTREQLIKLAQKAKFTVAVISGRSLPDLQHRVGLDGVIYGGNHGLEISGPGFSFIEPVAAGRRRALQRLSASLEIRLRRFPGIIVENKGLTASVHYRKAGEGDRAGVRRMVAEGMVAEAVASGKDFFQVVQGLEVLEIRPRVNWDKGTAAQWILRASGSPDALPVCIGDDATDEDAFSALAAGITVRVGRTDETSAHYQLEYQEAVAEFLAWLAELDDNRSGRHSTSQGI